jgi:isocitrate dehydrogenase (NAD+)
VTGAVVQVMKAMHAPVYFEEYEVSGKMDKVPVEVMDSIRHNKVCLKGGLATPVGGGVSSLNVQLRKELDLYASLVHCFNLPGLKSRHDNVNIVVIRENTEGEYSGLEHEVVPGVVESLKVLLHTPFLTNCSFTLLIRSVEEFQLKINSSCLL